MRKEKFFEVLRDLDDDIVEGAKTPVNKSINSNIRKSGWLKWGAMVACLCLIIAGTIIWRNKGIDTPGGGISIPGGAWPDGVDPVVASVAVIPAEESLLNVADATHVSIDEKDAKNIERLGIYLPDTLPEGCRYGTASYYETAMKDGTQYHMIRVTYENGQGAVPAPVTEDGHVSADMIGNTAFLWMVWDHRPDTNRSVYQPNEITVQLLEQMDGGTFYINYNGIYVGISQMDISTEELMTVIDSIG